MIWPGVTHLLTTTVVLGTLVHIHTCGAVVGENKAFLAITVERTFNVLADLVTPSVVCSTLVHI